MNKLAATALAVAVAGTLTLPARFSRPLAAAGDGTAFVYVVDWSGSSEPLRRRFFGEVLAEIEALPEGTRVVVFRMGSSTQETFDGVLSANGTEAVAASLARDLARSDRAKGTDFPKMAVALEDFASSFRGRELRVRVLTDGGDDRAGDAEERSRYRRAASELCADGRLKEVAFVGVRPGFREGVRAAFSKARTRLRILGQGEILVR